MKEVNVTVMFDRGALSDEVYAFIAEAAIESGADEMIVLTDEEGVTMVAHKKTEERK